MKFLVFVILGFGLQSEFSCWRLWHENGLVFAINKTCYFLLLVREYCSSASPPAARKRDTKQDHTPENRIYLYTRPLPTLLSPGLLTAHYPYHLMLLGSPPDMVREG